MFCRKERRWSSEGLGNCWDIKDKKEIGQESLLNLADCKNHGTMIKKEVGTVRCLDREKAIVDTQ